jgi:hypothetical protein
LTITTSLHELAASKARTSADPTCPVPPTTKTRKLMLCLSPSNTTGGIFKRDSVAAYERHVRIEYGTQTSVQTMRGAF